MNASLKPSLVRAAPPPPTEGRVRVLQFGPSLEARGGITSVERLICDHLPPYVSMRHVTTFDDGSAISKAAIFARAVKELRRSLDSSEPTIAHIHFASRGSTLRKMILAEMVARAGRPLILHAHGSEFDAFHRKLPAAVRRNVNRTLQRANVFITLSTQWRDFYVQECELSPSQVVVLPNPVRVPAEVPARTGRPHVQFVQFGRMGERKGTYEVLEAFATLPEALRARTKLVLAGDGETDAVRKRAAPLGERVTIHTWLETAARDAVLEASDVFTLPSRAEGVPMALLEAMAFGLPSITTPVGGIPDVFTDGVHGAMVKPGSVDQIRAAMIHFIEDENARLAAGRRAREQARNYDVHVWAKKLADIYQRIAPVAEIREIA